MGALNSANEDEKDAGKPEKKSKTQPPKVSEEVTEEKEELPKILEEESFVAPQEDEVIVPFLEHKEPKTTLMTE